MTRWAPCSTCWTTRGCVHVTSHDGGSGAATGFIEKRRAAGFGHGRDMLIAMRRVFAPRLLALSLCLLATLACTANAVSNRPATPASTVAALSRPAVDPASGLPVVRTQDLPPQAASTLALIERGGPFPHRQDGATFENREGHLPSRGWGYYKEYTVDTPGADDRGARRIVAGAGGERYWTDDHYDTFAWIAP